MGGRPLGPLDAAWVLVESETTKMQVGGLAIFRRPPEASADFVADFVREMRGYPVPAAPFNRRIVRSGLGLLWPHVDEVAEIDTEYHLRHVALPFPGGQRELGILVSRLHSIPLDLSRPPWEVYVIEGLERDRFALYLKVHHSLIDGVGAMRLLKSTVSTDPDSRQVPPPWAAIGDQANPSPLPHAAGAAGVVGWVNDLAGQAAVGARTAGALLRSLPGFGSLFAGGAGAEVHRAYQAPVSVLNQPITSHRRVATQSYDLTRFRKLARRVDGTVNDVVLAVCSGGLRRYLGEIDALPDRSLMAGLPVSVRPSDAESAGNAISFAVASLASDVADVHARIDAIKASCASAKQLLASMPRAAVDYYTMGLMAPFALAHLLGLGRWMQPFNLVISNVPGPEQPLYLSGALLEEAHPVSNVIAGQALTITALSYADRINLSFTACRDALPHVQRLSVACGEALEELEAVLA